MRPSHFLCPILAVAVGLPAQTTHLVGPGGLPQIRSALAIAAPGDTILVQPGTYAQFDANLGVQIRAVVPGSVQVVWDAAFAPPGCVNNLICLSYEGATRLAPPSGQTLTLVGLAFPPLDSTVSTFFVIRNRVEITSGRVVLDGCALGSTAQQALRVVNATVHLVGGSVAGQSNTGQSVGLRATNASITAVGTFFAGSSPMGMAFPGEAMVLSNTSLHGTGLVAQGGRILLGGPAAPALSVGGGSVWLSDSQLVSGGPNSCPFVGSADVVTARCTFGPAAPSCQALPTGPLLGLSQNGAPQNGQAFTLTFQAEPGDLVGVLWSLDLATRPLPWFAQPWWAPASAPTAGLFVADAQGGAAGAWLLPANPGLVGLPVWFHSFAGTSLPLSAAPPAGGVIR